MARSLSILEIFILALIERGIASPYKLLEQSNISIGASLPALGRLAERGLLDRGEMGVRRRRDYCLTRAGRKALKEGLAGLSALAQNLPADLETSLRAAALAAAAGKAELFRSILETASTKLHNRAGQQPIETEPDPSNPAAMYRAMTAYCSTKTLRSQAEALRKVQERIHLKR